jgi:hypothetical protein
MQIIHVQLDIATTMNEGSEDFPKLWLTAMDARWHCCCLYLPGTTSFSAFIQRFKASRPRYLEDDAPNRVAIQLNHLLN